MATFTADHFIPRWAVAQFLGISGYSKTSSPGRDFFIWRDFWDLNDPLAKYLCTPLLGAHMNDGGFVRFADVTGVTSYYIATVAGTSTMYAINKNNHNLLTGPDLADNYFVFAGAAGGGGAGDCYNSGWAGAGGNAGQVYYNIRPSLATLFAEGSIIFGVSGNGRGGNGGVHDSVGSRGGDAGVMIGSSVTTLAGGAGGGDSSSPNNPAASQTGNAIGGKGEKGSLGYCFYSSDNNPDILRLYNGIINSEGTSGMIYWEFSPRELGQVFPIPGAGGYNSYSAPRKTRSAAISRMTATDRQAPYYTLAVMDNPDLAKTFDSLSCGGGGPDNDMMNQGNPGTYGGGGGGGAFSSSHDFSSGGRGGDAWYCYGKVYFHKWEEFYKSLTI